MPRWFPLPPRTVEVQVGEGTRDVSAADSVTFTDALSADLGPVDLADSLALDDAVTADMMLTDRLHVGDDLVTATLVASAADSLAVAADLRRVDTALADRLHVGDDLSDSRLDVPDPIIVADDFALVALRMRDSFLLTTEVDASLTAAVDDEIALSGMLGTARGSVPDTLTMADVRHDAVVIADGSQPYYAQTVEANTNFDNPALAANDNPSDGAVLTVTQTGGLNPSSQSKSGTLVLSFNDLAIVPDPAVDYARLDYGWTTTESSALQSGNSVNMQLEYSLNDGASWTTLTTVTNVAGTGDPFIDLHPALTYTQLQQIQFRATGSVTSGTIPLTGGATQTFTLRYARIRLRMTQTL